jgi:hypothetical protein
VEKENCGSVGFAPTAGRGRRDDKGRVALTSAAVTGDGQSCKCSAIFVTLGGPKAHDSSGVYGQAMASSKRETNSKIVEMVLKPVQAGAGNRGFSCWRLSERPSNLRLLI